MTKKHFIAIAKIVHTHRNRGADTIASALADYFATINPNFDRQRFIDACGV